MPRVEVLFYREKDGRVPMVEWLDDLPPKARTKCVYALERLADLGYELRRPATDYLRDGIYELRVGWQGVNYRMLYFFHDRAVALVSHGILKERRVPPREIERAINRRMEVKHDPIRHTFRPGPLK